MIDTKITIDLDGVEKGLDSARRVSLGPVFKDLKKDVRADQREHAREKSGPDSSWKPLAKSTLDKRRAARKAGVRVARGILGKLTTAVSYKATRYGVVAESKIPWSGAHNDPGGATVGRGSKLPGRTFLYFSDEFKTKAADKIAAAVVDAFGGR